MRKLILVALLMLTSAQTQNGTIEVTVRDINTRQPIPAVQATLTFDPLNAPHYISTAFTDARGQASFKNLPYGLFELQLEHKGYALPTASSIWAVLRAEEPAHKHDVYLNRVAEISGRVLDEDGNPIVDATVTAWSVSHRLGLRMLSPASVQSRTLTGPWAARTNDRGEYRTPLYGDGEYYVRADISDPLETRQAGSLTRSVFYPGTSTSAKAIPVRLQGHDVSGIDIRVPTTPVFTVSGTLTDVPPPRPGPNGEPRPRTNIPFYIAFPDSRSPELVRSEASGVERESAFMIRGLSPGTYYLYAMFDTVQGSVTARTLVNVEDRNIEGVQIAVPPALQLRGRLVAMDGEQISWSGVSVGAKAKELLPPTLGFSLPRDANPRTGQFTLLGLTANATYNIVVSGLPLDAYIADIRQGGVSVYNGGTIRSESQYGEIEIAVSLQGGLVQGIVRDALGQTVPKAGVVLVPSAPRRGNTVLYKRMPANDQGHFRFSGIAPGEYKLFAWPTLPNGEPEEDELFLSPYEARGVRVRVVAGTSTDATVTVMTLE